MKRWALPLLAAFWLGLSYAYWSDARDLHARAQALADRAQLLAERMGDGCRCGDGAVVRIGETQGGK